MKGGAASGPSVPPLETVARRNHFTLGTGARVSWSIGTADKFPSCRPADGERGQGANLIGSGRRTADYGSAVRPGRPERSEGRMRSARIQTLALRRRLQL